jgi:hypothetical protein
MTKSEQEEILKKHEEARIKKQELENGRKLGYRGVRINNKLYEQVMRGERQILVRRDKSIDIFRMKKQTGYWVNSDNKLLHRERIKEELGLSDDELKGLDVHHIDKDRSNNNLWNLQLITKKGHMHIHSFELSKEEEDRRNYLLSLAREKAKDWHKSDDGREWHREHYKNTLDK